ncbi:MAG: copper ion binding protein, partial [Deltaproteobacteria bacterium]|nr:copper ion binding protein [Deltaproteobacteria bacterium]
MERDPVCGMTVVKEKAKGVSAYKGVDYYFCNPNCKMKFDNDPEAYLMAPEQASAAPEHSKGAKKPSKGLKTATLPITGMSCASCAAKIEKGLSGLSGIEEASVNFAAEKVSISYDPAKVHINDFVKAIRELGYGAGVESVVLPVQGMSCAACVEKINRALTAVPGVVSASVNFATEKANINYLPGEATVEDFIKAVRDAGYVATPPAEEEDLIARDERLKAEELGRLRARFFFAAAVSAVIIIGSFSEWISWIPSALGSNLLMLVLATPVQFWSGARFYRGAIASARHKTTDMNTLIAVGTSAAYLYSVGLILLPGFFEAQGVAREVYFDTSTIIITLILLGRYLEAKAKGRTS